MYLVHHDADLAMARALPCYLRVPLFEDQRMDAFVQSMPSPRLLKTHLPFNLLPRTLASHQRIVYVLRNPKDVAVSYYYFYRSLTELSNFTGSWSEFLNMFRSGYVTYGDWARQVRSWWQQRKLPNVLLISYEAMKHDLAAAVRKIATFLDRDLSDAKVQAIVEHTTFSAMRDNPSTNFTNIASIKLPFMRKGEVGDWKRHFTVEQSELFDLELQHKLKDAQGLMEMLTYEL